MYPSGRRGNTSRPHAKVATTSALAAARTRDILACRQELSFVATAAAWVHRGSAQLANHALEVDEHVHSQALGPQFADKAKRKCNVKVMLHPRPKTGDTYEDFFGKESNDCRAMQIKLPYLKQYADWLLQFDDKRRASRRSRNSAREEWERGEMMAEDFVEQKRALREDSVLQTLSDVPNDSQEHIAKLEATAQRERARLKRFQDAATLGAFETAVQKRARKESEVQHVNLMN